ncbi:potassium channel subfamily K member 15 [Colias croceus]|uniref:potassium channel subfamily K member 15 n=1 Tax=Colias crocea TaxID=72248 RepID=UPI001E27AFEB|nr:potassium channel subfamily K member 15 [Colias croceus]XP_045503622.1 potassium channel subfamily K member 15 [Colias croceus]
MARRKRRFGSRLRDYVRGFLAFLFSNVGIVVLVVAYTIAGAFMFQAIEGASEMERVNNMARERDNTAQYLWQNVTLTLNLFNDTALKERISIELLHYQRKIVFAVRRGWDGSRSSRQWSFSSAFLYSLTVITTIGYGHLSPRTSWGKIVTIFYALLGMPLFLLYLSNVGELLASWFKCIYALICLCRGCPGFTRRRVVHFRSQLEISEAESIERPAGWTDNSESEVTDVAIAYDPYLRGYYPRERRPYFRTTSLPQPSRYPLQVRGYSEPLREPIQQTVSSDSDFTYVTFDAQSITVPISVCVFFMVGYLMFGSMIFGLWERWDKLDGAYFCFISLSSIGFGDFVPGERIYTPRIETSFIVCSLYLMLGMALVAMCFNLMQEQVIHYYAGLKRAMKRICRCKR